MLLAIGTSFWSSYGMACYSGYRNKHVWDRVEIELRKSLVLELGESTVLMGRGHGSIHLHLHLGKRISAVTVPDYPNDPNDPNKHTKHTRITKCQAPWTVTRMT